MPDEGYIKFIQEWHKAPPLQQPELNEIILFRQKCFRVGLIGAYKDSGIGYENISQRYGNSDQFIVSGTQSGLLNGISPEHFTLVTSVDFEKNTVRCIGLVAASSESLTHAAFYDLDKKINCVIHIHRLKMWERLKNIVPATNERWLTEH